MGERPGLCFKDIDSAKMESTNFAKGGGRWSRGDQRGTLEDRLLFFTEASTSWNFGRGRFSIENTEYEGGIYFASNVASTCRLWDCRIIADRVNDKEIIGRNGDIEHLRSTLKRAEIPSDTMKPNNLYWITDRTPHEVLPMKHKGYRQFVRIVCHEVGVWYEAHSTPNPFGLL